MRKIVTTIDNFFNNLIHTLLGLSCGILFILTNVLVVFRYVFAKNLKGLEELPIFLLIICVWLGGALVSRNDEHIKIDLVDQFCKSERVKRVLAAFMELLSAVASWIYTYLSYGFVATSISRNTVSPGLQFPMWYVHIFMLIGALASSVYFTNNTVIKFMKIRSEE